MTRFALLKTSVRLAAVRVFPIGRLLPLIHEVHTLTSQTGFETLLRGVRGSPMADRFTRNGLVAGALLLYPSYYHWQTGSFCRAEDICCHLLQSDGQMRGRVWARLASVARGFLRRMGQ